MKPKLDWGETYRINEGPLKMGFRPESFLPRSVVLSLDEEVLGQIIARPPGKVRKPNGGTETFRVQTALRGLCSGTPFLLREA